MAAVSAISTMKVERPPARSSAAPTREKSRSTRPSRAASAGTKSPAWASTTISAFCRSKVDLPAMFGPVSRQMRRPGERSQSFGTKAGAACLAGQRGVDHRVAAGVDGEVRPLGQLRPAPAALGGELGGGGVDVDLGQRLGGGGDAGGGGEAEARAGARAMASRAAPPARPASDSRRSSVGQRGAGEADGHWPWSGGGSGAKSPRRPWAARSRSSFSPAAAGSSAR